MNCDLKRVTRKILAVQTKRNHKNTMRSQEYNKQHARNRTEIKNEENISKPKWKKQVKGKIGKSIEERTKQDKTKEEQNKTKAKTK